MLTKQNKIKREWGSLLIPKFDPNSYSSVILNALCDLDSNNTGIRLAAIDVIREYVVNTLE